MGKANNGATSHLAPSEAVQYILAALLGGLILLGTWKYTLFIGEAKGLSILNKTMSSGTLFLLSVVLLIGPMNRLFGGIWRAFFILRREIGMVAFLTGAAHVYLSMFPLARRGPFGFYEARPWSAYPGLLGLVLMAVLFAFSFMKVQKLLSAAAWWKLQYMGARIALLGIVVHTIVLRWNSWVTWAANWWKGADVYPPLALLGVLFAFYVLKVKLIERWHGRQAKLHVTGLTFASIVLVVFLFVFPAMR